MKDSTKSHRKGIAMSIFISMIFVAIGPTGFASAAPTPHAPISISGDAAMHAKAASEGWPGDGSAASPYIISGYHIDASSAVGIYLRNVHVHVEISNNTITDPVGGTAHHGIVLSDSRARIVNNHIAVELTGIHVSGQGPDVERDFFSAEFYVAFLLPPENLPPIRENYIERATTGIRLAGNSFEWHVDNNEIHNTTNGIVAWPSDTSSPITNNLIEDCSGTGVLAVPSEGGTAAAVSGNTISRCGAGIYTYRGSSVANNVLAQITNTAIQTDDGGRIQNNDINGASLGIRSRVELSDPVSGNTVRNTVSHGIQVDESGAVTDNLVENAGGNGMDVGRGGTFTDNVVRNAGGIGMYVRGYSSMTGNIVAAPGSHGIVTVSGGCISSNTVTEAGGDGIRGDFIGCLVGNQVSESLGHGISAISASGDVEDNVVRENGGDGIAIDELRGWIVNNVLVENGGDGLRATMRWTSIGAGEFQAAGNMVTENGGTGLNLAGMVGGFEVPRPIIAGNQVSNNVAGIRLASFPLSTITGNHIADNGIGLTLENPGEFDELMPSPGDVELGAHNVFDNAFANTVNAQVDAGMAVKWYTDARPLLPGETNIAGGGWLGGNLWSDYAGTDADGDGFGDTPHQPTADPARLDHHPLV